jgi:hypothetical protein
MGKREGRLANESYGRAVFLSRSAVLPGCPETQPRITARLKYRARVLIIVQLLKVNVLVPKPDDSDRSESRAASRLLFQQWGLLHWCAIVDVENPKPLEMHRQSR